MVEDINQNRNDFRYEPTSLVGATTSTRLHKGQPMQILEHNGQLFVALQEDYPLQNKLISDLTEYEGALKLGRISIGNRLHPVTVYQPANKMTFCTNCWLIGHTRATCSVRERKCRICLK
ncbi:unnamed protein product, partial [Rotaria sp. Silwood1]